MERKEPVTILFGKKRAIQQAAVSGKKEPYRTRFLSESSEDSSANSPDRSF